MSRACRVPAEVRLRPFFRRAVRRAPRHRSKKCPRISSAERPPVLDAELDRGVRDGKRIRIARLASAAAKSTGIRDELVEQLCARSGEPRSLFLVRSHSKSFFRIASRNLHAARDDRGEVKRFTAPRSESLSRRVARSSVRMVSAPQALSAARCRSARRPGELVFQDERTTRSGAQLVDRRLAMLSGRRDAAELAEMSRTARRSPSRPRFCR